MVVLRVGMCVVVSIVNVGLVVRSMRMSMPMRVPVAMTMMRMPDEDES